MGEAAALLETVKRALAMYTRKTGWSKLVANGMRQDWSWERAAREYVALYKWTIEHRGKTGKAAVKTETKVGAS